MVRLKPDTTGDTLFTANADATVTYEVLSSYVSTATMDKTVTTDTRLLATFRI